MEFNSIPSIRAYSTFFDETQVLVVRNNCKTIHFGNQETILFISGYSHGSYFQPIIHCRLLYDHLLFLTSITLYIYACFTNWIMLALVEKQDKNTYMKPSYYFYIYPWVFLYRKHFFYTVEDQIALLHTLKQNVLNI